MAHWGSYRVHRRRWWADRARTVRWGVRAPDRVSVVVPLPDPVPWEPQERTKARRAKERVRVPGVGLIDVSDFDMVDSDYADVIIHA